ncbi:thiosulfate sulfurtransferase [Idiomarina fontislapidosi]|jgi:thiosulfate sulfurtransferase|uniref:Thiosulfate sulfurtransferase GlpE n=1 Tax=Idiomarina fontislapidosi TaxID=263723 RepID=A0A432XTZ6_9GAMM|nr:thiosulfate sulfurtransferase GlpE [Idiomarina fontislapidosi]PYE31560.1 thiosulfate sulfurtransferase [Idiomarina fontislapidosi]RUO52192.1 thiosulfate sulfurtransferase GlpE [Idiomarina fontislapidosi]|tara:strand:+ start:1516 stop:1845 length:330 start_codon:yes stop_codon:yes gene_type:complete
MTQSVRHIALSEAHQAWASDKPPLFVDIRDPQSFHAGHIPTAQPLNNDNISEFLANTDKDAQVIVVCYHGISSQQAALVLEAQGLTHVSSMDGGFTAWQTAYPDAVEQG